MKQIIERKLLETALPHRPLVHPELGVLEVDLAGFVELYHDEHIQNETLAIKFGFYMGLAELQGVDPQRDSPMEGQLQALTPWARFGPDSNAARTIYLNQPVLDAEACGRDDLIIPWQGGRDKGKATLSFHLNMSTIPTDVDCVIAVSNSIQSNMFRQSMIAVDSAAGPAPHRSLGLASQVS